ncbi:EamA family transporter [Gaetbulibacter saemankumensis]|uniref:EamA family transporter n=1 Tax=Gaetbulibacter saemankumensis TaxID=311208 RepID=UPI0004178892|nr:EamA family transporter [Gaetbulibacter saemankumensis]
MSKQRKTVLIVLAFFAIYVIWGSTYLLNKIVVQEVPPFFLAGLRFTTAGVLIFILAKILKVDISITWKQFKSTIISGFLFLSFGNGVVVWALKYVDSGFAALEIAAQPLVVLILMRILQGKKISAMSYVGVALGILGVFLLVGQKEIVSQDNQLVGMLMIFTCMISWSYASIFVGKADLPKNHFVSTGYQMILGGLLLILASLCFSEPWSLPTTWSQDVLWAMLALVLFGSVVAFSSFNFLLKVVSPEKVATSTYINPIIALFLGWWILDEQISGQSIIAATILLTGVYFINSNRKFKPRSIGR